MNSQLRGNADSGYELHGSLTYDTVPELFRLGELQLADSTSLNLEFVERIDSAGVALLIEWSCAAKRNSKTLTLKNIPGSLTSLIDVSDLEDILSVSER